jgi:hypothetical protein
VPYPKGAPGPVFVVGAMGSGTTLMRLILDSHPNIAIAQETGFMRAVLANKWIPFWKFGGEWYGRIGLTERELDAHLRNLYDTVFQRFAEQQGKRRWGDKTPYHTWHMSHAARVFPNAVFVATVRHPGAVATSLHSRFRYDWPKSVGHWMRSNLQLVHQAGELGDRLLLCRYEDLVVEPEGTIRELLDWLGEPWAPQVLKHNIVHGQRGMSDSVEGQTRSTDPIDPSRIGKWTGSMDAEGYRVLRMRAAPLARYFGYDLDDPFSIEPLLPATSVRRRALSGLDLHQRQAAFRDTVDWDERPAPSMENQPLKPDKLSVVRATSARRKANPGSQGPREASQPAATPGPPRSRKPLARLAHGVARRLPAPARARLRNLLDKGSAALSS